MVVEIVESFLGEDTYVSIESLSQFVAGQSWGKRDSAWPRVTPQAPGV